MRNISICIGLTRDGERFLSTAHRLRMGLPTSACAESCHGRRIREAFVRCVGDFTLDQGNGSGRTRVDVFLISTGLSHLGELALRRRFVGSASRGDDFAQGRLDVGGRSLGSIRISKSESHQASRSSRWRNRARRSRVAPQSRGSASRRAWSRRHSRRRIARRCRPRRARGSRSPRLGRTLSQNSARSSCASRSHRL